MGPRLRFIAAPCRSIGAVQLVGLVLAVFFLIRLMPADPAARLVGLNASPEALAAARHSGWGLIGLCWPSLPQYLGLNGTPGLLQGQSRHRLVERRAGVDRDPPERSPSLWS